MLRWYYVFFIALLFSLATQTWLWSVDTLTDESIWAERLEYFRHDLATGTFVQRHYSAHPGLAPLWVALIARGLGASPAQSLEISVIILVSLLVGAAAATAYAIWPVSAWWVAVSGLMALHPLFVQSSVANAVAGPAAAVGLLLILLLSRRPQPSVASLIGLSFGVALLTHFSLSALLALPALLLIFYKHGWHLGTWASAVAAMTFTLFNPLFLQHPVEHFRFNFHYIALHTTTLGVARLHPKDIVLVSPFAVLGFLGTMMIVWRERRKLEIPPETLLFFAGVTVAVSAVLLYSRTQSTRYFFSLIMFWEILFAWWLLRLASRTRQPGVVAASVVGLLVAGQAILLLQALY